MKALMLHADLFEYQPVGREIREAEEVESLEKKSYNDVLVAMISVEDGDGDEEADSMASEIIKVAREVKSRRILLYPYAHLSSDLAPPSTAKTLILRVYERLREEGVEVFKAPFGWTKKFKIEVKGHPLAEQLKSITPLSSPGAGREGGAPKDKFHRYVVIDVDGSEHEVNKSDWERAPVFKKEGPRYKALWFFVRNELRGKPKSNKPPKHIHYMRKLELVDYCPESDVGHMKWYPKGVLIRDLILDYAFFNIAREWGAMKMQNPMIYRMDVESIRLLQGEFHERDYVFKEDGNEFVLRFASDPGAFPFVQKLQFTYRQMPVKVYEEAYCFRKEQKGELTGLMRVRSFLMTDHHAFCINEEQAKQEYKRLSLLFKKLMDEVISGEYWVLGFEFVEEYYERFRGFIIDLVREMGVPAFVKIMKEMSHYYAFKSEYQAVFPDGNNLQVSTVQWDVKNGARFNISYVDEKGERRPVPIILHASSFGSIERALASMLERAAWDESKGLNPTLQFWISPEQVRVIPVDPGKHLDHANRLADELEKRGFRVGVDDRDLTVSRRVLDAKRDWVNYIVVIGDREVREGVYTVTPREGYEIGREPQVRMSLDELIRELESKRGGMPTRPMYLPRELSKRPQFTGVR